MEQEQVYNAVSNALAHLAVQANQNTTPTPTAASCSAQLGLLTSLHKALLNYAPAVNTTHLGGHFPDPCTTPDPGADHGDSPIDDGCADAVAAASTDRQQHRACVCDQRPMQQQQRWQ